MDNSRGGMILFFSYSENENDFSLPQEIKKEVLLEAGIFKVIKNTYQGGMERVFIAHPGAVTIIATTPDDKLLLIKQFRAPAKEWLWEIPAGTLEPGEEPLFCAQRELEEETGFSSNNWQHLFPLTLAPGYSSEIIHFFRAKDVSPVTEARAGDEDELIYLREISKKEAQKMLDRQEIKDAKTRIGIYEWMREER